jgi:hypothetical protein
MMHCLERLFLHLSKLRIQKNSLACAFGGNGFGLAMGKMVYMD